MRKGKSGNCYVARTVMTRSLQRLAATFFPGRVVQNTETIIKESLDCLRKNFDALKGCVRVARPTAVTTLWASRLNSTVREQTCEHLKTVETDS